ncbi:TPA: PASTA domain-containing protein, partial [Listeria monocytogenes]
KIVQQLPQANSDLMQGQKVILMTDGDMTAPNMVTWSKDDALKVSEITGVPFEFSGSGYVKSQSVSAGSVINSKTKMKITLAPPEQIS